MLTTSRPSKFEDIIGQEHLTSEDSSLRRLISIGEFPSSIFYGPSGVGKTSLAHIIADNLGLACYRYNAGSMSIVDVRKAIGYQDKSLIVIDDIYRLAKNNQDVLLSYIEDGRCILIGTTTENPFHSMRSALISRSMIFQFNSLSEKSLAKLLLKITRSNRVSIDNDAAKYVIRVVSGDARKLVKLIELSYALSNNISIDVVKSLSPSRYMVFNDDLHYDYASAFQGSIQASDADAAVFWLAKWLESGEDPRYIARRLIVSASEDSFSNPYAAIVAQSAYIAACEIGRPECDIIMSHATILIAQSKRDKTAAKAIWAAVKDVKERKDLEIPKSMKDSHYPGANELGNGKYHDGADQSAYVGVNKKYIY